MKRFVALSAFVCALWSSTTLRADVELKHRWVWCMHNLATDANVDFLSTLMERAKKCGYTGFVLSDYKFNVLDRMDRHYFNNVERLKAKARELGLDLIPTCIGIGYSEGILVHDPNLAEGFPVVDAPFVVKGGKLVPVSDGGAVVNGDFEEAKGVAPAGWYPEELPPYATLVDDVAHDGKKSLRFADVPKGATAWITQKVATKPVRAWRLSVWIRTENLVNPDGVVLTAMGRRPATLSHQYLEVKRTQDWTEHHVAFNTLENGDVRVTLDVAGGGGKLWVDNLRMEPLGFVNVLRRDACPVKLASSDGKTVYVEGRDVAPVVDPKLGREKWSGTFAAWHTPPEIAIPAGSRLKEGDRVLAGYFHPMITLGSQLTVSLTDPKVYAIIDDQITRTNDLFHPKFFFMGYDEIRTGGWTPDYADQTCGEALAKSVKKSYDIIKKHAPEAEVLVWNDMFDPNHNAQSKKPYYLVKGGWAGSWEGLPKDVIVMDWLSGTAQKSFDFFNGRGNARQMMAGYYDGDPDKSAKTWVDAAKASKAKIIGIMYTTWAANYKDLEAFIEAAEKYAK